MTGAHGRGRTHGWLVLAAVAVVGCVQVKEHLTVRSDGSGTLKIVVSSELDPAVIPSLGQGMGPGMMVMAYPPVNETTAAALFPGDEFDVKVSVRKEGDAVTVTTDVSFEDVDDLLDCPYARAVSLSLRRDGGRLHLVALSGIRGITEVLNVDKKTLGMVPSHFVAALKKKDRLRYEFAATMPGAVRSSSGSTAGNTARWVMDRARLASDEDAEVALRRKMEASCSAAGLAFTPKASVRLSLMSFDEVKPGPTGEKRPAVDEEKILAAARFVPYRLKVVRYFDLVGEGHGGWERGATLNGAVTLPRALAPQKWGKVALSEARDEVGTDLAPRQGTSRHLEWMQHAAVHRRGAAKPEADVRHLVVLAMKCPAIDAKRIERLRASVELLYFRSREIAKVKHAVAQSDVADLSKGFERMVSMGTEDRAIGSEDLERLGVELKLTQAHFAAGFTLLMFSVEAEKASLEDIQVYDADGLAWQTTVVRELGLGPMGSVNAIVLGRPKPPLSLALVVTSGVSTVSLPLKLDRVAIHESAEGGW
jgi:hypothetical protein